MLLDESHILDLPITKPETGRAKKGSGEPLAPAGLADVVAELETALEEAKVRQTAISTERKAISLAAHMGSADDRTRLDQLNQDGAVLAGEIESLEAAIAEAKTRIAESENAAAIDAERQRRREVVQIADAVQQHAENLDRLWRQSVSEYCSLQDRLYEISQSGFGKPSRHVVQTACRRALITAFIGSPLQLELLAPGERHSVADLVQAWTRGLGAWAEQPVSMPKEVI